MTFVCCACCVCFRSALSSTLLSSTEQKWGTYGFTRLELFFYFLFHFSCSIVSTVTSVRRFARVFVYQVSHRVNHYWTIWINGWSSWKEKYPALAIAYNLGWVFMHRPPPGFLEERETGCHHPDHHGQLWNLGAKGAEIRATKIVQLVRQHCCLTSCMSMLLVLPPQFQIFAA